MRVDDQAPQSETPAEEIGQEAPHGRCLHCHSPLPEPKATGRRPRYCPDPAKGCRRKHHRARQASGRSAYQAVLTPVREGQEELAPLLAAALPALSSLAERIADLDAATAERVADLEEMLEGAQAAADAAESRAETAERAAAQARREAEARIKQTDKDIAQARAAQQQAEESRKAAWEEAGRHQHAAGAAESRATAAETARDLAARLFEQQSAAAAAQITDLTRAREEALDNLNQAITGERQARTALAEAAHAHRQLADELAAARRDLDTAHHDLQEARGLTETAKRERDDALRQSEESLRESQAARDAARAAETARQEALHAHAGIAGALEAMREQLTAAHQRAEHAIGRAAAFSPDALPDITDINGTPGVSLGDAQAVLIENGQVLPVRLPDRVPLTADQAIRIGRALLAAATHTRSDPPTPR